MIQLIVFYIFFLSLTYLLFKNAHSIWKITKDYTLPLCTLIIFYFTLAGALFFPIDAYFGFKGAAIGLHYLPIFERLFVVSFDSDYMIACSYYFLFAFVFQYTYIFAVKKIIRKNEINSQNDKISDFELRLNPYVVLLISVVLIVASFYILRREIFYAIANHKSIYLITRANKNPYYTLHQLANEFCVMIPFLAYSFAIVKSNNCNIFIGNKRGTILLVFVACALSSFYISFLGNRREILSGIIICVLISVNQLKKINYKRFTAIFLMVLVFFLANIYFRSTTFSKQLNSVFHLKSTEIVLKKEEQFKTKGVAGSLIFSNELFYAHFSMYGALHKDIPLTYGSSLVYLVTSVVPRALYPDRPPDIYSYYATSVRAVPGQNYTLHHATAWYLNFGLPGLIVGALILAGVFILAFYINFFNLKIRNSYLLLLKYLLSFLLCAQVVTFITAGPEAYKSLFLEGVVIPIVLLRMCFAKRSISSTIPSN